ncbi:hypothetical protein E4U61_005794 [Claviceps capensis]|nr:hypothetical protein E4U61_005794 [Claviceps capensis]
MAETSDHETFVPTNSRLSRQTLDLGTYYTRAVKASVALPWQWSYTGKSNHMDMWMHGSAQ